ncbi:MAG TPA: VWA domain-containing protein [Jatrophihabitans sp.]
MARVDIARRHERFDEVSPQVGTVDDEALERVLREDPSAALELLADMTIATDERLRARAKRLARAIVLDRARAGRSSARGTTRLRSVPADRGGDLDVDASLDAIAAARATGRAPGLDELVARDWGRPELAACLLVDASGSMSGARLAAAALTAAACAWRAPAEFAVLSFAREVRVHRALTTSVSAGALVERLLALRGHGVTALANALQEAGRQLAPARAPRRVTVLLSDCRATDDVDPVPVAGTLSELLVLAPADDCVEAAEFAARAGARWEPMAGAADAPAALARLLDG